MPANEELVMSSQTNGNGTDRRRAYLSRHAVALGRQWADETRTHLGAQGRAAGAWPGTLSEARALVDRLLVTQVARRRLAAPTDSVRSDVARELYDAARKHWNSRRQRDEELED
jgi:hypothetical protein